jgi:anti-sigma factor RsiW
MTEPDVHIVDDLAAYILEALPDSERGRVEAHVATCATCARRLDEYRRIVGLLPLGLKPVTPPSEAWTVIRGAARRYRRASKVRPVLRRAMWPALATLAASLLLWNVTLQREISRHASGPQVEALARRPGRLVILSASGMPNASGRLLVAIDGIHGHLAVAGLEPLGPGRVYQLWFVQPGALAASAAAFTVDGRGRAWVTITAPMPLDDTRLVIVTEEPAPGSATPTGPGLMGATSWR